MALCEGIGLIFDISQTFSMNNVIFSVVASPSLG